MKPHSAAAAADPEEEIAALERHLHETQQRLQVLQSSGAGQQSLGTTQAAILNALPAHIALVDGHGVIRTVNETWRHFASANALLSPDFGVGQNYLKICDDACGPCANEAHDAAAGIRSVLSGAVTEFVLEYPCHSPVEERWYRLGVSPLGDDLPGGVVVMHVNITERKQTAEKMQRQQTELRVLFDLMPAMVWFKDTENRILRVNQRVAESAGKSVEAIEGRPSSEIYPQDAAKYYADDLEVIRSGRPKLGYVETLHDQEGQKLWVQTDKVPYRDPDGKVIGIVVMAQDVTTRRQMEEALRKSEEHFRFLNDLTEATRTLVDPGQIMAVMARMLGGHLRASRCVYAVMEKGSGQFTILHDYTDGCASSVGHYELSFFGPRAVTTLNEGRTLVLRNIKSELRPEEGEETFSAIGIQAIITCPLVKEGGLRALMAVHQTTPRDWQPGEIAIVQDVVARCWATIERKAAEEESRLLAERLTSTLESLNEGFYTVDDEWRLTYVNREAERMTQRARAEVLGGNLWEQFPNLQGTPMQAALERAHTEQTVVQLEAYYPPLGRWFEMRIYPSAQGLAVYFRDVSEPRQAREALRLSEERFRLLTKATNDGIWDWNLGTNELWWNEGFETLFGFSRAEVEPTIDAWTSRIHPADRTRIVDAIHRSIDAGEEKWSGDYRFRRKDGQYAYVFDRGYVLRDPAGKPLRMIGGMTDLTERTAAADRVAEQAALLNAASDAIILSDLADRIVLWNRSAEQIYGWTAAEVVGRKTRELLAAEPAKFDDALRLVLHDDHWRGELQKHTRDGRILMMDVRWTLVRDEAGQPKSILAIDTDITERKKLEAQFLRVQRMESIGTMAGGIAHDLNNILAPIMMSVGLLQREVTSEVGREMLETLQVCSQRGADLVRQVLSFARGIEGQRIVVNPIHLVREIQNIVRETFPKNITFKFSLPRELGTVIGDPTQLHQVLMNLCVNARDAMPMGGALTVAMENIMVDEIYSGMNPDSKPGDHVMIEVSDTGTGIPPEIRERIFEPFFTTKEIGKGTGLGLSTSLAIVRSHGGFFQVHSQPGRGTHFKVYLPAHTSATAADRVAIERAELPRGQGELILLVDDEESIRSIAHKTLTHHGYRVIVAANGAEAVALYATQRDTIAVVLTDMAMPVMDGPAAIVALKTLDPRVKIIGSSGLAVEASVAKAVGSGVQHFIPKPYTAEAMLTTLHKVLHGTG